jgi:F0F1-type ATP synthase membrane subunit b/b'
MDLVIGILKQLGADSTLWQQFLIVTLMYFLSKYTFLDHLQKVIETREEKTVKLEDDAEKQFEEINKLSSEYKEKITSANKSARTKLDNFKKDVSKNLEGKYRSEEKNINDFIDNSRKEVEAELAQKKDQVLSDAESLANSLVEKIVKGS